MYIESLFRLATIIDEYDKRKEFIVSEKFHKETVELLESQTKMLMSEIAFKTQNPGPYDFGFGDLTISIFSPDQTDIQEWAAIARKGTWQKNYRFNSILGLIHLLTLIVKDTQ